jgi:hypothetical protein
MYLFMVAKLQLISTTSGTCPIVFFTIAVGWHRRGEGAFLGRKKIELKMLKKMHYS